VLCPRCRRQVARSASLCGTCGLLLRPGEAPLELVLVDGARVPVLDTVTIGRAPGNTIQLDEPTVSRHHARIVCDGPVPQIEDAGSRYGTLVDGRRLDGPERLWDGARIKVGDAELLVAAYRAESASDRTIVVPPGASVVVSAVGAAVAPLAEPAGNRPRVRPGWALKRLEAGADARRYVLKDLRSGKFARMSGDDAALFELIDGTASLHDLIVESTRRLGPDGPTKLASLLAELGERGLLEGVDAPETVDASGRVRRLLRPRTLIIPGLGEAFESLYRRGGFLLFTAPALVTLAAVALVGAGVFAYMIATGGATPFVVGARVGLGGLVFLLGRFLVVLLHEIAHGLTVASFGRRVFRAGLKLVLIFPYAFVDTSEAWFEPRRRRIAISAAGPASDLTVGGAASLIALAVGAGSGRDVFFQLALAAYIGAFFNLNPLLERDGYHMLVDVLDEPGLRRRSQEWLLAAVRGGRRRTGDGRTLGIYAAAAFAWSLVMAAFAIVISRRYYEAILAVAPRGVVWILLGIFYLIVLIPVIAVVYPAVAGRLGRAPAQVDATG
jgi:putative peptide zinc metalloprotease protein